MTQAGIILGTAAYMSPEQARGRPVDRRTDIWAFGCVLFEMLAAARPFAGETVSDTIGAVLRGDPNWEALPGTTPPALRQLLGRCLRKDPGRRLRDIGDARLELEDAGAEPETLAGLARAATPATQRRERWALAIAGVSTLLALGLILERGLRPGEETRPLAGGATASSLVPVSFDIVLPDGRSFPRGIGTNFALSPDGSTLVYVALDETGRRLYLRRLAEPGIGSPIAQSEGAARPSFSPDGRWILFWDNVGGFVRLSLESGERYAVCDACDNAFWAADGWVYFNRFSELWRGALTGGEPESVVAPADARWQGGMVNPVSLPGGRGVVVENGQFAFGGISVLPLDERPLIRVSDRGSDPSYAHTGHILFSRGGAVVAVPFDLEALAATGPAAPVLPDVRVENGGSIQLAVAAQADVLAFEPGVSSGTQLTWVDRGGATRPLNAAWHIYRSPRVSPDGRHVVVTRNNAGATDLLVVDLVSGGARPITTSGDVEAPEWSPDSSRVAFGSGRAGSYALEVVRLDGAGDAVTLLTGEHPLRPESWHPQGDLLVFSEASAGNDMYLYDFRDGTKRRLVTAGGPAYAATISHNGAAVAYESDDGGGASQLYVQSFPTGVPVPVSVGGGRSAGGGTSARWSADDTLLFYIDGEDRLRAASVRFEPVLEVVPHAPLFSVADFWTVFHRAHYDVAPDGRLLLLREGGEGGGRIRVILNWLEELNRRAPAAGAGR